MKKRSCANSDWQESGGSLEVPDGWFVTDANFDCPEPYIKIASSEEVAFGEKKIPVPKSLAYFLSVHSCGSIDMHNQIYEDGQRNIRSAIMSALGLPASLC